MAVSMRFDAQLNRLGAASANVGNAISYSQTQDAFLQKVGKALDRMSELATLAQDITKTDSDRSLYQKEFSTLQSYITDISSKNFNGVTLFQSTAMTVTVDSDPTNANGFTMAAVDLSASQYSNATTTVGSANISNSASAVATLATIKTAITQLATDRAQVGANIVRLDNTNGQMSVLKDNLSAANSRIKDVDVADESTQFARYNILVQAGTAMLAQANTSSQSALKLLG
jgi:flagellin